MKTVTELIMECEQDCQFNSDFHDMRNHSNYQKVVFELRDAAIPELFENLGKGWFVILALYQIFGESAPSPGVEGNGNLEIQTKVWRAWAEKWGFIK